MSKLLRHYSPGSIYFVTAVTHKRQEILAENADLLLMAIERIELDYGIDLTAWVVMPDHFHLLMDPKDGDLSGLMRKTKLMFSHQYRMKMGMEKGKIWQSRFWDHVIRDQDDMNRHIDYIHYNPVRHGLTSRPVDWKYSSIHGFIAKGFCLLLLWRRSIGRTAPFALRATSGFCPTLMLYGQFQHGSGPPRNR